MKPAVILLLTLSLYACRQRQHHTGSLTKERIATGGMHQLDTTGYREDTGSYSFALIPLSVRDSNYFMYIEEPMIKTPDSLTAANRRDYYEVARKSLEPEVLKVHGMIWALPEVQAQAAGDGRLHTVATEILSGPEAHQPYYFVRAVRDHGWRMGRQLTIPFFHVYPRQQKIMVYLEISDTAITLAEWRRRLRTGNAVDSLR